VHARRARLRRPAVATIAAAALALAAAALALAAAALVAAVPTLAAAALALAAAALVAAIAAAAIAAAIAFPARPGTAPVLPPREFNRCPCAHRCVVNHWRHVRLVQRSEHCERVLRGRQLYRLGDHCGGPRP